MFWRSSSIHWQNKIIWPLGLRSSIRNICDRTLQSAAAADGGGVGPPGRSVIDAFPKVRFVHVPVALRVVAHERIGGLVPDRAVRAVLVVLNHRLVEQIIA